MKEWDKDICSDLSSSSFLLSDMLNNALDLSKLEEGKIEFDTQFESIIKTINMIISLQKRNAESKGLKLLSTYSCFLPPLIKFDKGRITQV
jgi:signal transduction histidine kinase